jgi:long-subunit fatty acid transport protein
VQLEAIMSYQVNDKVSVGLGGRYWYLQTHGGADFESVIVGLPYPPAAQPLNFNTTRYGAFAQGAYKFGPI